MPPAHLSASRFPFPKTDRTDRWLSVEKSAREKLLKFDSAGKRDFPRLGGRGKCWPRMRNAGGELLKFNPSRVASTLHAQCRWKWRWDGK